MSFTGKAAGWLAGRLKGEKARKKTINWMNKTGVGQLLGAAGDAALVGGAARGAAKGLGALKGMFTAGSGAAAAAAGPSIAERIGAGEMLDEGGADILGTSAASVPEAAAGAAGGNLKPMPSMVKNRMTDRFNIGPNPMRRPITSVPASAQAALPAVGSSGFMGSLARGGASAARGAAGLARSAGGMLRNPQVLAAAAGGIADVIGSSQDRAVQEQQLRQQDEQFQQRFNVEEEERKRQQAQANRLASFFMPTTR